MPVSTQAHLCQGASGQEDEVHYKRYGRFLHLHL